MQRALLAAGVVAMLLISRANAGTIYTNQALWEAALSAQTIVPLTLTPQAVPSAGTTVIDDQLTLQFPANHGGMEIFADGWRGDVHEATNPTFNRFAFASPILAVGFQFGVGEDISPTVDRVTINLDQSYTFRRSEYAASSPHFLGWIGDNFSIEQMLVTSEVSRNLYVMRNVQYVLNNDQLALVPLPNAAYAGFALLPLALVMRRRVTAPQ